MPDWYKEAKRVALVSPFSMISVLKSTPVLKL